MSAGRLPTFLIIGAPRCGTTSLAMWLAQHPEVFFSDPKELHFFNMNRNWERGLDFYRAQFAGAEGARAVGEGTPNYMLLTPIIRRVAEALPEVQLIACLREPVSRAYSNWHLHRSLDIEPRPFEVAIEQELADPRDPLEDPWRTWEDAPGLGMDYVAAGDYLPQLQRLVELWGRERLHVVLFDDIRAAPQETFAGVCRFLGVDDAVVPPAVGEVFNSYGSHSRRLRDRLRPKPRTGGYEPMPETTRERLQAHFAPRNAALAEWLGVDLGAWR